MPYIEINPDLDDTDENYIVRKNKIDCVYFDKSRIWKCKENGEWIVKKGKWRVTISHKGKRHYVGCYYTEDDAIYARDEYIEKLIKSD